MSNQNTGGGYWGSRGRFSRPSSRSYHRYRHDGDSFANDSFGSQGGVSQGRGKYSQRTSHGRGWNHSNDKSTSNFVYRPKKTTPDVISNSSDTGESQMKQSECNVASNAVCDDNLHPSPANSDSSNIHLDMSRMQNGDSEHSVQQPMGQLDGSRIQIGESPKKETEDVAAVTSDFSVSDEGKFECKQESPQPAKAVTENWNSIEKGAKILAGTEDGDPSPTDSFGSKGGVSQGRGRYSQRTSRGRGWNHLNDKSTSNFVHQRKKIIPDVISNSSDTGGSQMKESECNVASNAVCGDNLNLLPANSDSSIMHLDISRMQNGDSEHSVQQPVVGLDVSRIQIGESPKKETEDVMAVTSDFSVSDEGKFECKQESPQPAKAVTENQNSKEKGAKILAGTGHSGHSVQQTVIEPFDICPPKIGTSVMLKPSLLVSNRQKRNEVKPAIEGRNSSVLRSGMVILTNYLSISDQVKIVKKCRELGLGLGGFYQPGYREGGRLHLKMMCLGKNWDPETSQYGDIRTIDDAKPPTIPSDFYQLVEKAIKDSHALIKRNSIVSNAEAELPCMSPNICIVNFYSATGKLGLHQDRDESPESLHKGLPVVSFSIGDSAEFSYSDQRDVDNAEKVRLESGDVLIFGGKSRHIFHGVSNIVSDTGPKVLQEQTNFRPGRLNLTFRQY